MTVTQPEHPHSSLTPLQIALKKAQARNRELENYIQWEERLFANAHLSATHKLTLIATRHAVLRGQTHDEAGRTRLNLNTIAERIGVSPDTVGRNLKYLEHVGVVDRQMRPEIQENGERWTRVYASLNEELLKAPEKIVPECPRNHGGTRYRCQHCGSEQVTIKRRVTLVCKCCQHESVLEESERYQTVVDEDETAQSDDLQDTKKPVSPPTSDEAIDGAAIGIPADDEQVDQDALSVIDEAVALLLALAGPSDEHIEMSRGGPKKYYTVQRKLTREDLRDHLQGGKARGALCQYPNGQTRGLGWDTDTPEQWAIVEDAARRLARADFKPILEPSPAKRGGHLWIIFDAPVDASAARHSVYSLAPSLEQLTEYWPGPQEAKHWNNVRLPGGRYVRPGINAWCQLVSVVDGETSRDGYDASRLLLAHQTPAAIVPSLEGETNPELNEPLLSGCHQDKLESDEGTGTTSVQGLDSHWYARYGQTGESEHFWFAFTPVYVAAWYNAHHDVHDMLPPEKDGYGLAQWRGERTASVAFRDDQWTDFGASAKRVDGSQDGGDALELQVRVSQEAKSEVLRQAAKELIQEARMALECAASNGEPIPAWLEDIITDAGRAHYERVRTGKQGNTSTTTGGLTGSSLVSNTALDAEAMIGDEEQQEAVSAQGAPSSRLFSAPIQTLMQERNLIHGEACSMCACELYRDLYGESACCRCYPQKGYHQYSDQIDAIYPRKKKMMGM